MEVQKPTDQKEKVRLRFQPNWDDWLFYSGLAMVLMRYGEVGNFANMSLWVATAPWWVPVISALGIAFLLFVIALIVSSIQNTQSDT